MAGNGHAKAYYGVFRLVLGDDHFAGLGEDELALLVEEALAMDKIVDDAVAEHSLSPHSIEAAIRNGLLPRLYKLMGMDNAKQVIDRVIQITRVGLSRGEG